MKRRSAIALVLGCGVLWICACGAPPSSVAPVGAAESEPAKAPPSAPAKGEAATAQPLAAADPASASLWEAGPERPVEGSVFKNYRVFRSVSGGGAVYSVCFKAEASNPVWLCSDELASLAQFLRRMVGKKKIDSDRVQSATGIWSVPVRNRSGRAIELNTDLAMLCQYSLGQDNGFTLMDSGLFSIQVHVPEQDIDNTLALFTKALEEVEAMRKVKPSLDP